MPDVTISFPTAAVSRVKAACVHQGWCDDTITNADLLALVKTKTADYWKLLVKAAESEAQRQALAEPDTSGVAS